MKVYPLLAAALAILTVATRSAQQLPANFDASALDTFLTQYVKEKELVGLSVALVQDGRIELAKGYGRSSLHGGGPPGTNTLFAIGSVTKQFTCACILLLAEDGKLSLHDKVAKYYPALARANDITLLDLMNHTSGYPDYYPLDFVDRRMAQPISEEELIAAYAGGKLDFEPGTRWSYSNTGYVILGRVVEKVSGQAFGQFLTARILKPLGMEHTLYDPMSAGGNTAQGYTSFALGPPTPVKPEGHGWVAAAGAIYSTPSDLARWNLALMDGTLLRPASFKLMTTPRTLAGGQRTDYGCGLAIQTRQGTTVLSHNGAVSGFAASSSMIPSKRSSVVLLCNSDFGLGELPARLLSLLLDPRSDLPAITGPPAAEAARNFFGQLQSGQLHRDQLGEEFSHFMDAAKVRAARRQLKRLGELRDVEVRNRSERGGMEVANVRLQFKSRSVRALMYRSPDGKIQQFLVLRE